MTLAKKREETSLYIGVSKNHRAFFIELLKIDSGKVNCFFLCPNDPLYFSLKKSMKKRLDDDDDDEDDEDDEDDDDDCTHFFLIGSSTN